MMPTDAFGICLPIILREEGGFVNLVSDPGGMTALGVTRDTWEDWTGKDATEADMRTLTPAKVAPLYRQRYWDVNRCDDLPPAVALCVFDFGINAGPARAARYLQKIVGAAQDGQIGPKTLAAVVAHDVGGIVRSYQQAKRNYYRQLPTFRVFGKGWLARADRIEIDALGLA